MKIMVTFFKMSHACTAALSAPSPAAGHHWPDLPQRFLDTHGQVCFSLLWGHCSLLLDSGAYKVLFVPSRSLFPQSCVSSGGSMVGFLVPSSKRIYAIPRSTASRAPPPAPSPLLTDTSAGDTQTQFWLSLCGFSGSWCTEVCLSPPSISGWYGLLRNANWLKSILSKMKKKKKTRNLAVCLGLWTWDSPMYLPTSHSGAMAFCPLMRTFPPCVYTM